MSDFREEEILQALKERQRGLVVAVDGPSGVGKSTQCRRVATALNLAYLDTGAMFRMVCWAALDDQLDLDSETDVTAMMDRRDFSIGIEPHAPRFAVDGTDVTAAIREPRIAENVSSIAVLPGVRQRLKRQQRDIIDHHYSVGAGCVAEGRDITTVVAPDAEVRILLSADADARVQRRHDELQGRSTQDVGATRVQVVARDAKDSRSSNFSEAAQGVHLIDSTTRQPDETFGLFLDHIHQVVTLND